MSYESVHGALLGEWVVSQLPTYPRTGAVPTLGCGRQPALGKIEEMRQAAQAHEYEAADKLVALLFGEP
jgi:hypothetical protein